jgi:hydroxymethylglutaryl-CoA lyase
MIRIIESPREGMQGFSRIMNTEEKVRYINQLLRVGFDTVEIGSIVSPKHVPQMAGSLEVLEKLDLAGTSSNRMFLAVNTRGAEILAEVDEITHISYPFSFTPTFLKNNMNVTVEQSFDTVANIVSLCRKSNKQAVIYVSMAFGNPYGDAWDIGMLVQWVKHLHNLGVRTIPLSNVSVEIDKTMISEVFATLIPLFPDVEFGLHLHTANFHWFSRVEAAYNAGCRRFDGVINGWGGCPMSGKEMLGNLKTENLLEFAKKKNLNLKFDTAALKTAYATAGEIFRE